MGRRRPRRGSPRLLVISGGLLFTIRAVREEVRLAGRRSDFVFAVTHELRTPLTGIKMYADLLKAGWVKDDATRDEYVGFMADEADRLARLVNRVLDFARTDRGRRTVEPLELSGPIREVERDFGPQMAEKGFALDVRIEDDSAVLADPDAVKQILLNLLENAVKYAAGAEERRSPSASSRKASAPCSPSRTTARASPRPSGTASSWTSTAPARS